MPTSDKRSPDFLTVDMNDPEDVQRLLGRVSNEARQAWINAARSADLPQQGETPLSDALDLNTLDSNDIRAWRTLARQLEHRIACIASFDAESITLAEERGAKAALSSARSTYVPLTREEIEKVRSVYKRHFSDGERLDTVCDMAINALLYAQEIDRLRSTPSAIRPSLPPMNEDLGDILGRPNFTCRNIADLLRFDGTPIRFKAEDEQAHAIHFLLGLYLEHGKAWREKAKELLGAINERRKTASPTEGAAK